MFEKNRRVEQRHFASEVNYSEQVEADALTFLDLVSKAHGIGYWRLDVASGRVNWSRAVYEIHGLPYSTSPVDLGLALDVYHEDDANMVASLIRNAIEKKTGFQFVLRLKRADGSLCAVESTGQAQVARNGEVTCILGTFRNVTQTIEEENRANACSDMLVSMIKNMPASIAVVDSALNYLAVSDRWIQGFRLDPDMDMIGQNHYVLFEDLPSSLKHDHQRALGGEQVMRTGFLYKRLNGHILKMNTLIEPWYLSGQAIGGLILIKEVEEIQPPTHNSNDPSDHASTRLRSTIDFLAARSSDVDILRLTNILQTNNTQIPPTNSVKLETPSGLGDGGVYDAIFSEENGR